MNVMNSTPPIIPNSGVTWKRYNKFKTYQETHVSPFETDMVFDEVEDWSKCAIFVSSTGSVGSSNSLQRIEVLPQENKIKAYIGAGHSLSKVTTVSWTLIEFFGNVAVSFDCVNQPDVNRYDLTYDFDVSNALILSTAEQTVSSGNIAKQVIWHNAVISSSHGITVVWRMDTSYTNLAPNIFVNVVCVLD